MKALTFPRNSYVHILGKFHLNFIEGDQIDEDSEEMLDDDDDNNIDNLDRQPSPQPQLLPQSTLQHRFIPFYGILQN
ncbi:unnamed protein product [Rotaria sp. Silwood2]|nr:unnamed protein product [Rotaria sp. Silwood2]CAF3247951.1 unnamed protein product [Rotaria sp. Silwood2]CAF4284825.1 unnamed protein product [Rotaria sp. Silwood2]